MRFSASLKVSTGRFGDAPEDVIPSVLAGNVAMFFGVIKGKWIPSVALI